MNGRWVEVTGTSMNPYLVEGDKVFIQKDISPRLGNVVLFSYNEKLIIHRYIDLNLFKGDNLKRFDQEYPNIQKDGYQFEGVATHRLVQNNSTSLSDGSLVRLLSLMSAQNHANLPLFHRFYQYGVSWIGRFLRLKENMWGNHE